MAHRPTILLLAALVAAVALMTAASAVARSVRAGDSAGRAAKCRSVSGQHNFTANGIRVRHTTCHKGRNIAESFISRLGCNLHRRCSVNRFECASPNGPGESTTDFRVHCHRGERRVGFTAHLTSS
jgi:hypothetical protein